MSVDFYLYGGDGEVVSKKKHWRKGFTILPKKTITGQRVWGVCYKRDGWRGTIYEGEIACEYYKKEYANKKEVFEDKLKHGSG